MGIKSLAGRFRLARLLRGAAPTWRGYTARQNFSTTNGKRREPDEPNPLRDFFAARKEGHGIWKWDHYFDIYHRHLNRYRGKEVHILEIGIYSGGSLQMWREYFGPGCHIYGVDIMSACQSYEDESTKVFIGDQADRDFWRRFREAVPRLDIVIDDGGHQAEQQIVSLEELLPHLQQGGSYLCEDVLGTFSGFASYVNGFAQNLNAFDVTAKGVENATDNERRLVWKTTPIQSSINSIHLYPFVTVVERNESSVAELVAPKHGTQWQPHLK